MVIKAKDKGDLFWSKMELNDNGVWYKKYTYGFDEITHYRYSDKSPTLSLKRSWGVAFIKPHDNKTLLNYAREHNIPVEYDD